MKPGDRRQVRVPSTIPPEYGSFHAHWRDWLKAVNGQKVTLDHESRMGVHHQNMVGIDGWIVDPDPHHQPPTIVAWLPSAWLLEISNGNTVISPNKLPPLSYSYCNACGGSGKHKLMCPTTKVMK
jgi:hypothetical protein